MAQQPESLDISRAEAKVEDTLVNINKGKQDKQVLEINNQMKALETSINKLSAKLTNINKQVKNDLQHLNTADAEITDKVTETYKQLGVMDDSFQQLSSQSSQIKLDLKKVNKNIKLLEKETRNSLNSAIENQSAINEDFGQSHQDLISRSEKLSKKTSAVSRKLEKSIKENNKVLSELQSSVVSELENMAQASETRDNSLDDKIDAQKAKLLLMQGVDDALEKRAIALENTSQLLIQDNETLKDITHTLDVLTSKLTSDIESLESHTAQLAEQNNRQQGMIDDLHKNTDSLGRTLLSLASLEQRHFRILGTTSLILLLAVIAIFLYGEYSHDTEAALEAQRNSATSDQISDLQNRVAGEQQVSQVFYQEIATLDKNVEQVKSEMRHITDEMENRIQSMTDQVDSIDGRLQYMNPLYNFGSDNTIHGSQWISGLDKNLMSIKIATVENKQQLYEIAQRYSNYFTDDLAYFSNDDQMYTLIYSGKFVNQQQVEETLRRMPRYMNRQLLAPISNAEVLNKI